jgi:hypothetical protein
MEHWQRIADNLSKAGWRCGCISSTDHEGRQFWVVAAEREDAGRFSLRAELKEQRTLIQKVSAQLEVGKTAPQTVLNNQ